jgi:methylenetetrahydrofolate reductase (NADPH)
MSWTRLPRRGIAAVAPGDRQELRRLLEQARYELIPLRGARTKAEALPAGATVTVTASPAHGIDATLDLAEWLQARGHQAVPHLSARLIRDAAHLGEVLQRARSARLTRAFVVGGDPAGAEGMRDGLTLLRAMADIGHPFVEIGVPAYPEGHPSIPDDVLQRSLEAKTQYVQHLTTQMSFDAAAVSAWIDRTRAAGITLPIHLGLPGAIELRKLMTIAARIGVAGTARYLTKNRRLLGNLLLPRAAFTPDAFIAAMAPAIGSLSAGVAGLHLFTFNQAEETAAWVKRIVGELG